MDLFDFLFGIFDEIESTNFWYYYLGCFSVFISYCLGLINLRSNNFQWRLSNTKIGFIFSFSLLFALVIIFTGIGCIVFVDLLIDCLRFLILVLLTAFAAMFIDTFGLLLFLISYEKGIMISRNIFSRD
jgi:hypothetical protein